LELQTDKTTNKETDDVLDKVKALDRQRGVRRQRTVQTMSLLSR